MAQTLPNASRTPFPSSSDALTAVPAVRRPRRALRADAVALAGRLGLGQLRFRARRLRRDEAPAASAGLPALYRCGESSLISLSPIMQAALTLVSSLSGAAVASMFYLLDRRQNDWPVALCATLIMALSPLYWLQSGLALTDMFGMVFVLAFLLVEGTTPATPRGDPRKTHCLRRHRRTGARRAAAYCLSDRRLLVHPRSLVALRRRHACLDRGDRRRWPERWRGSSLHRWRPAEWKPISTPPSASSNGGSAALACRCWARR